MKIKILLLAAVLTLGATTLSFAAPAWVARQDDGTVRLTGTSPIPNLDLKPSANVFYSWDVLTNGTTYSIGTIHTSGTFSYATSSVDTNIYRMPNDDATHSNANATTSLTVYTGTAYKCPAAPVDVNTPALWTGWTASK